MSVRLIGMALPIGLALLMAGCGPHITRAMRKTPEYRAGYQDGCSSAPGPDANMRNGFDQLKNDELFRTDRNYRAGWNAGYTACRSYTPQGMPQPYAPPVRDQNPGYGGLPHL